MNAVLPDGNKQHLILSTGSVQLNGKLRLGEELAPTQGSGERGCERLDLDGTIFVPATLVI